MRLLFLIASVQAAVSPAHPGEAPLSLKAGEAGADGLLHWGDGQLDLARSQFAPGTSLILAASWLNAGSKWPACSWSTPGGSVWKIEDGLVVDEQGVVVEGVQVWAGDGEKEVCGVKIEACSEEHRGRWMVSTQLEDGRQLALSLETEDDLIEGLRLPQDFEPISYDIGLVPELFPSTSTHQQRFRGTSLMQLRALATQPSLTFHSDELAVNLANVSITRMDSQPEPFLPEQIVLDFQRTFVTLVLGADAPFQQGVIYNVMVHFASSKRRGNFFAYGFHHQPCTPGSTMQCWYTQFESTNARNAFPCLDEPSLKAEFNMYIGRSQDYKTLSNMPLKTTIPLPSNEPSEAGWLLDVFYTSVKMSPYLVAVVVTWEYEAVDSELVEGGPVTKIWAPAEEVAAGRADYAALIGPPIIQFYEDRYGIKYPLAKMDMVSQTDQPGAAMENWGLMIFDTPALLIDPDSTNDNDRFWVLNVVAHELAHQWFGNIVTLDWWDQMWLNEGFAEYVSNIASHYIDPEIHTWERFYVEETQWVMYEDQDTRHHWAMTDPVTTRDDIDRKFGDFTYLKGGSFNRMVSEILTEEAFTAGLSSYLAAFAYSSTTEDDLFFHLEEAAMAAGTWPQTGGPQGSLGESLKLWTQQPGLPLVSATKSCTAADGVCNLTLTQEWLTFQQQDTERRWDIKVIFESGSVWLNAGEAATTSINLQDSSSAPLVLGGKGYFRVNYDTDWWREIAEILRTDTDQIDPMNRAQIICDVLALEELGYVSHNVRKDVLSYFPSETEFGPLLAHEQCSDMMSGKFEPRLRRRHKRSQFVQEN